MNSERDEYDQILHGLMIPIVSYIPVILAANFRLFRIEKDLASVTLSKSSLDLKNLIKSGVLGYEHAHIIATKIY